MLLVSLVPLERIHRNNRFSHPFAPKFGESNFMTSNKYPLTLKLWKSGEVTTWRVLRWPTSWSEPTLILVSGSWRCLIYRADLSQATDLSDFGPWRAPGDTTFTIRRLEPPTSRQTTDTDLLTRLNSWVQPGLYEREFRELMQRMRQCSCGMFMIQDVFNEHRCEQGMFVTAKRMKMEWKQVSVYNSYSLFWYISYTFRIQAPISHTSHTLSVYKNIFYQEACSQVLDTSEVTEIESFDALPRRTAVGARLLER